MVFQFKKFSVSHGQSAMKVGTDGVLLGALAPLHQRPNTILDIGAGTGLVALMLAQRSDAMQIDAIEINAMAYEECVENFENSPWNDRLFCYHADFDNLVSELAEDGECYDLLVSNPPYFKNGVTIADEAREMARNTRTLSAEKVLVLGERILAEEGLITMIIPYAQCDGLVTIAENLGLHLQEMWCIKGMPQTPVSRCILTFGRQKPVNVKENELVIETARNEYTDDYKMLLRDFLLKF